MQGQASCCEIYSFPHIYPLCSVFQASLCYLPNAVEVFHIVLLFLMQGARGFPGTPGLPGIKGHRVSLNSNKKKKKNHF